MDRWKKITYDTVLLILTVLVLCVGCGQDTEEELQEISLEEIQKEKSEGSASKTDDERKESKKDEKVFVYLCGEVVHPGVYEVSRDSRLYEVIAMAGGLTADAAQEAVNQAKVVEDAEQICIPSKEEMQVKAMQEGSTAEEKPGDGKVNLNTATREELMTLSGVGESRADSIVAYREEHGGFKSTEELMQISGIKEGLYHKIKDNITV